MIDGCSGLLSGSVAYKMGGFGEVCIGKLESDKKNFKEGPNPLKDLMHGKNYSIKYAKVSELVMQKENLKDDINIEIEDIENSKVKFH